MFNESKKICQKDIEKSGYQQTSNENASNNKRKRKQNVILLKPPLIANVKIKV